MYVSRYFSPNRSELLRKEHFRCSDPSSLLCPRSEWEVGLVGQHKGHLDSLAGEGKNKEEETLKVHKSEASLMPSL